MVKRENRTEFLMHKAYKKSCLSLPFASLRNRRVNQLPSSLWLSAQSIHPFPHPFPYSPIPSSISKFSPLPSSPTSTWTKQNKKKGHWLTAWTNPTSPYLTHLTCVLSLPSRAAFLPSLLFSAVIWFCSILPTVQHSTVQYSTVATPHYLQSSPI